jgi:bacillithiol biosynthesis deacetylase BshB1
MDPLDLVAFSPHPDDAELFCGGTLALTAGQGRRAGIVDLTAGESGSYGDVPTRSAEAAAAAEVLGLAHRESLGLPDGRLADTDAQRASVVAAIRRLRPRVLILPFVRGRHPDHSGAAALVRASAFLAGVRNYAPGDHEPHKPEKILYATAFRDYDAPRPTFVVDISSVFERKMRAVACYRSQFAGRTEAGELFPTGRDFPAGMEVKFAYYGSLIHVRYGEPFYTPEPIALSDVLSLGVRST